VAERYAIDHGVPARAILIENRGRSTIESLRRVASLMDGEPSREVILVSDPFHMLRLTVLARRYGLLPHTSPTRTSPISSNVREFFRYALAESVKVPIALLLQRNE
ncbi:MAG TPA: YdcF family protein, partial [Gemmatimonadaceae bacterium]|nr:YdcF family protein [Gemmatimonadaceae bacterium]